MDRKRLKSAVTAVDGISFNIGQGETLGLVGESGCGKTTTGRMILRLEPPTHGRVCFKGRDIQALKGSELKEYRSKVQAVFQDPWSSLNPRMRVKNIVAESLAASGLTTARERKAKVIEKLNQVGLSSGMADRYPHEFSGGQRQRVAIAAALISSPELIVLDEPVSALDVSIRAQVMNLLKDLQQIEGMAYLLIAHDLATVRYMANRMAVMYLGQVVEYAQTESIVQQPFHPYTQGLFAAALPTHPTANPTAAPLQGEVPSPIDPPTGCRFHPRCPAVMPICSEAAPEMREVLPGHLTACHLYESAPISVTIGKKGRSDVLPIEVRDDT